MVFLRVQYTSHLIGILAQSVRFDVHVVISDLPGC